MPVFHLFVAIPRRGKRCSKAASFVQHLTKIMADRAFMPNFQRNQRPVQTGTGNAFQYCVIVLSLPVLGTCFVVVL